LGKNGVGGVLKRGPKKKVKKKSLGNRKKKEKEIGESSWKDWDYKREETPLKGANIEPKMGKRVWGGAQEKKSAKTGL